jgi:hypothetical protein
VQQIIVDVAGYPVALRGDGADFEALVLSLASARPSQAGAPGLVLHALSGSVSRPRRPSDAQVQHVHYWYEQDHTVLATSPVDTARVEGSVITLDPGPQTLMGLHSLLLPCLSWAFGGEELLLVHAGGFTDELGAVLALGASGQGKSSLITAALSAGRTVLGDDMMLLRSGPDGLEVAGVPVPLALPADLDHESSVGRPVPGDWRERRHPVPGSALDASWHPLRAVVLVRHSTLARGDLSEATGQGTFHRLLSSTLEGLHPGTVRRAFRFAAAVARCPAWHLGHSQDPLFRVPDAVERLAVVRAGRAPAA